MKSLYYWDESASREAFVNCIKSDGVVLADSDTVLGLFAAVTSEGVKALDAIKTRRDKPYLIIIGDRNDWQRYAKAPRSEAVLQLIEKAWPGPLTLILNMRPDVPDYVGSQDRTVGLRFPSHEQLCVIAKEVGGIFSTSANKAGFSIPTELKAVDEDIKREVCITICEKTYQPDSLKPSTILDCSGEGISVVREGAYSLEALELIAGHSFKRRA